MPELRRRLGAGHGILCAPPGSGKTTFVPLALLGEPWLAGRRILMLEPRRAAARLAAGYMASTLGEAVGETVGYRVRFEQRVGAATRVEVMTEGILTRRLQTDPELTGVGLVIFDEFHERSLQADLGLALCLDAVAGLRPDLRLLAMSATLDAAPLARLLGADAVVSEGRQFTVAEHFAERPCRLGERVERAVELVGRALNEAPGDILLFLPGRREIERAAAALQARYPDLPVERLYGELPPLEQERVLRPRPGSPRRVVLSTDVAETSVTIPGIRAVVDAGLARKPRFDPGSGLTRLETVRIARDSATQRAGRAGRLEAGACYRAWTAAEHERLAARSEPEILAADLAGLVLELAAWGVTDPATLAWQDPPPAAHWAQAVDLLTALGALDAAGRLTAPGRAMVELPVHPRLGHLLVLAGSQLPLAADLAALLTEPDPLRGARPSPGCDVRHRLDALRHWRSGVPGRGEADPRALQRLDRVAARLAKAVRATPSAGPEWSCGALLSLAYPDRIARRRPESHGRFLLASGREVVLPAEDALAGEDYLVVPALDAGATQGRAWLAAPCTLGELTALHAGRIPCETRTGWDASREAVVARQETRLGALVLASQPVAIEDRPAASRLLLEAIARRGLDCLGWSDAARTLQARVETLRALGVGGEWPEFSDDGLRGHLDEWLTPWVDGMTRLREVREIDLRKVLEGMLPWELRQRLDELAPEQLVTAAGTRRRIAYHLDGPPVLAVPIQEMYGTAVTPTIAQGRQPLLLHLLSPAGRPLQVTRDLASFWTDGYVEVRKTMRGRYPKHHWPEDPRTAQATVAGRKPRP